MSRFISGFASVFCFTLFPIWVEGFAMKRWVNFIQTTVQVSNTLGGIIGYFFYLIMGRERYKLGFFIESLSILILTFILITIPSKYYNKKYDKIENYNISKFNIIRKNYLAHNDYNFLNSCINMHISRNIKQLCHRNKK